jgi:hypothetical protein
MKFFLFVSASLLFTLLLACSRPDLRSTEDALVGEWDFLYEYVADGTTTDSFRTSFNTSHPYAMLQYTYSSGFVLHEDRSFHVTWYGELGEHGHRWALATDSLILTPDEAGRSYSFPLSDLGPEAMDLTHSQGKVRMIRISD